MSSDSKEPSDPSSWDKLRAAMAKNPEFAWTIHCSYATQIIDEGVSHDAANRAAAWVMRSLHGVFITRNPHWIALFGETDSPQPSGSGLGPKDEPPILPPSYRQGKTLTANFELRRKLCEALVRNSQLEKTELKLRRRLAEALRKPAKVEDDTALAVVQSFIDPPPAQPLPSLPVQNNPVCVNSDRLEFLQACVSEVSLPGGNKTRREKEGDSWDGATIPWWARFAIGHPFAADLREASYWHDRACEESRTIEDRLYGDAMFLVLMQRAGVRGWRRWAAWLGVVMNSIFFWRRPSSGRK